MFDSAEGGVRCWKLLNLDGFDGYVSVQNFDDPSGYRRLQGSTPTSPSQQQSSTAFF